MTQPKAIAASNFFINFEIVTGISKTPGTFIIFVWWIFFNSFRALFNNSSAIFV